MMEIQSSPKAVWARGQGKFSKFYPLLNEFRLVGYSSGNFGKSLLLTSADVTLLFLLTDRLGIAPSTVGALMLVVLVGDLFLDLVVGAVVTWARSKGVSYRVFVAAGAAPCGAAFALLYALPWLGGARFWVLAIALVVFRGAYSIIDVPHNALLAEITSDSRGRGRASGYRSFFSAVASLAVASIITPSIVSHASRTLPTSLAALGLAAGSCFCLAMLIAAACSQTPKSDNRDRFAFSLKMILPKFDRLAAVMAGIAFLTGFAMPMLGRMMLYVSTYVLGRPLFASQALMALAIGIFAGVVIWTLLVRRFEKKTLLAAGHVLNMFGILGFAGAGSNLPLMAGCVGLMGVGLASVFMLPWGLLADIVDFAEFRHRERREAALFAAFLVIVKASAVASVGFIGWAMAELHYVPGVKQSLPVQTGVQFLALGMPFLGSLMSVSLICFLPITHRRHGLVLKQLERRRSELSRSMGLTRSAARDLPA